MHVLGAGCRRESVWVGGEGRRCNADYPRRLWSDFHQERSSAQAVADESGLSHSCLTYFSSGPPRKDGDKFQISRVSDTLNPRTLGSRNSFATVFAFLRVKFLIYFYRLAKNKQLKLNTNEISKINCSMDA